MSSNGSGPAEKVWILVQKTATLGQLLGKETRSWDINAVTKYCYENQNLVSRRGGLACFALGNAEFCVIGFDAHGDLRLKDKRDGVCDTTVVTVVHGDPNYLVVLR
jgi:hypothetical protein